MKKQILLTTGILLVCALVFWWALWLSGWGIPEKIPHTPIHIGGVLIFATILNLQIRLARRLLRVRPELTIWGLTIRCTLPVLIEEAIFQFIRQFSFQDYTLSERLTYYFQPVLIIPLSFGYIAFLVAFQIKTKKTMLLLLLIALIYLLLYIAKLLFPQLPIEF